MPQSAFPSTPENVAVTASSSKSEPGSCTSPAHCCTRAWSQPLTSSAFGFSSSTTTPVPPMPDSLGARWRPSALPGRASDRPGDARVSTMLAGSTVMSAVSRTMAWSTVPACWCISRRNAPPSRVERSWYVPCSSSSPRLRTRMRSALRTVERRCAMMSVVRPCMHLSRAAWTSASDLASSAEVASSRSRIFGFFATARAIATRCFWPPDSWALVTSVSNPPGSCVTKLQALATFAAATIS
mmetsp:Transcript_33757/g.77143  ORF Transcript_33757/g.77143 Transcript_33757/m.77143 type:complete len:241 (+) Transcript_33757:2122-2844(+)